MTAAAAAARSALLKHVRVSVRGSGAPPVSLSLGHLFRRWLSSTKEEVRGSFLDKSEVADRIVTVVKNFQKVDPSKLARFKGVLRGRLNGIEADWRKLMVIRNDWFKFIVGEINLGSILEAWTQTWDTANF